MKDYKMFLWTDLFVGFNEISNLLSTYKFHIENLNGKRKDEEMEEFIENQMVILKSLCDSHLCKIQVNLITSLAEWKKKKEIEQ